MWTLLVLVFVLVFMIVVQFLVTLGLATKVDRLEKRAILKPNVVDLGGEADGQSLMVEHLP